MAQRYEEFDWEFAKGQRSPEVYELLQQNYNKKLTEEQFLELFMALPRNKEHASATRAPSSGKNQYRRLRDRFGFFTGEL